MDTHTHTHTNGDMQAFRAFSLPWLGGGGHGAVGGRGKDEGSAGLRGEEEKEGCEQ